jgi:arabinogalactan oligomer/maltooligosaccharide transport system substrate-binding protein
MKKLFILQMLLILSIVCLVACGGEDTTTDGDAGIEMEPADIGDELVFGGEDILLWIDDENFAEALIEALEVRFPDTNFSWHEMGNVDSLTNLSLDGPAKLGADIIFFPHDHIDRAVNEQLVLPLGLDISDEMHGRFHESAIASVAHNDNYWGIPLTTQSVAFFYNQTLIEELGFEPATTFEEIFEQGAQFNNPANNEYILRWQVGDSFFSHFALTAHGFQLFGPNHIDAESVNFDTPEVIAGLEWLQTVREELLPVPVADLDGDNTVGAFTAGEVPYVITGPWAIGDILRDGDFELGVKEIPTINGNQPITFSGNIVVGGSAFTEHPPLVRAILQFLMSDEGLQIMYDVRGEIPALIDGSSIVGLQENPYHSGILAQANHSHPMPIISEMSSFWAVAGDMYSAVWDGIQTPEEAAAHAYESYLSHRALAEQ